MLFKLLIDLEQSEHPTLPKTVEKDPKIPKNWDWVDKLFDTISALSSDQVINLI